MFLAIIKQRSINNFVKAPMCGTIFSISQVTYALQPKQKMVKRPNFSKYRCVTTHFKDNIKQIQKKHQKQGLKMLTEGTIRQSLVLVTTKYCENFNIRGMFSMNKWYIFHNGIFLHGFYIFTFSHSFFESHDPFFYFFSNPSLV